MSSQENAPKGLASNMLLLIDNYDSFTYNLVQFLGDLKADCAVVRNDKITAEEALARAPDGIVLSPGPCTPAQAGICIELVRAAAGRVPILGVCLGHQAICEAYGGRTVLAPALMHGKTSPIEHEGRGLFEGLPSPFTATRYHSLVTDPEALPPELGVTARTADGTIMAVQHAEHPVFGVQFHPESIASEHGHALLGRFLDMGALARAA